jgi:hypothetical protein
MMLFENCALPYRKDFEALMAKIDLSKVEAQISQTLHSMFVKKLLEGRATISSNAIAYFGLDDGKRPKPQDPIVEAIDDLKKEEKELEWERYEDEKQKALAENKPPPPPPKEKPKSLGETPPPSTPTKIPEREKVPTSEEETVMLSPLFILSKHFLWFKKKKIKGVYETLKTTEEEIQALQDKKMLSELEKRRVEDILINAKDFKEKVIKELGLEDDLTLIEAERKKHLTKRFHIKETWLPL